MEMMTVSWSWVSIVTERWQYGEEGFPQGNQAP